MKPRNLLFVVAWVIVMGACLVLMGQGLTDGVRINLPYAVTVGDVVLDPGEYEVRMPSQTNEQILRFFSNDKLRYQTVAQTIPTEDEKTPEQTKVLLHHIGDQYYFDKIWMEGRNYGFEFPLPDKARALQRELAVTLPAKVESVQETNGAAVGSQPAALTTEPNAQTAAATAERESSVKSFQTPAPSEQADSTQNVAALQREQPENRTPPAAVETRQDSQVTAPSDQLPATASNWFAYLLSGVVLLALAGQCFKARAQE